MIVLVYALCSALIGEWVFRPPQLTHLRWIGRVEHHLMLLSILHSMLTISCSVPSCLWRITFLIIHDLHPSPTLPSTIGLRVLARIHIIKRIPPAVNSSARIRGVWRRHAVVMIIIGNGRSTVPDLRRGGGYWVVDKVESGIGPVGIVSPASTVRAAGGTARGT
jgi:hypothetical protein